ncbi:MAG: hypothetical protein LUQ25_02740 [Methanoregulaceae archaeon]|nr:hypothetical protein [Methanoregulaceae archaeon]
MNVRLSIVVIAIIAGVCISAGCTGNTSPGTTQTPVVTTTQLQTPSRIPTAAVPAAMLRDMASLDQAYIPVLALTTQNDAGNSRKAIDTLMGRWAIFNSTYYRAMPGDPMWSSDFQRVNTTISSANRLIAQGNLTGAHTELEQFRLIMLDLRTRNHIDYFIDKLTLFHAPMEEIVLAAQNKAPEEVDTGTIREIYPAAVMAWNAVKGAEIDAALFDLNETQAAKIRTLINNETAALDTLGTALKTNDSALIGNVSVAIKGPFSTLFSAFGKFPG